MSTMTITIDTSEWTYIDKYEQAHVVTNAESFTMALTDIGTGGVYVPSAGQSVALDTGYTLELEADPQWSWIKVDSNSAETDNGYITFLDPQDGTRDQWKVRSIDMDDADAPAVFTAMVCERVSDPMRTFTWATVTVSTA